MSRTDEEKRKVSEIIDGLEMGSYFPKYLQDLLAYNGYTSHAAICQIGDEEIKKLEAFARDILPDLLCPEEISDFYGIFARNIKLFCIVEGHKKMLMQLSGESKLLQNKCTQEKLKRKNQAMTSGETPASPKRHKALERRNTSESADLQVEKEGNTRVECHIDHIVKSYAKKLIDTMEHEEKMKASSLLDNLRIELDGNIAYIHCFICNHKCKAYNQNDSNSRSKKWVLSNVNRHFKTHFKSIPTSVSNTKKKHRDLKTNTITSYFKCPLAETISQNNELCIPDLTEQTQVIDPVLLDSYSDEMSNHLDLNIDLENIPIDFNLSPPRLMQTTPIDKHHYSPDFQSSEMITVYNPPINSTCKVSIQSTPKRRTRLDKQLVSRHLNYDPSQTHMTDFFELCEKMINEIAANSVIYHELLTSGRILSENNDAVQANCEVPLTFFEMVKAAAIKNTSESSPAANRYPKQLKKLSLYLYLTAGRLAYQTLAANIPNGLPSITTLCRDLSLFQRYAEGELAMDELKLFLERKKYPLHIFISEDQTAIIRRPRYSPATNQLVGYVLKNSKMNGFPITSQNKINTIADIQRVTSSGDLAKNAYVFMAQPLADRASAFCITIFGSDNTFSAEHVLSRWRYLVEEARKRNIVIEGFSSDGDSRCLKAMKMSAGLPQKQTSPYAPYFQAKFTSDEPVFIQDTVHIGTKMKTRLLNPNIDLKMGHYQISRIHIEQLIQNQPKDRHLLCLSYLDNTDKMNFKAIDMMSSPTVTSLLMENESSRATAQLLIITRFILDSFLDKSLSIQRRIYLIWYATFFMRLWRAWIKEQAGMTLSKNWISLNTYTCIELNAHGLLMLVERHRAKPDLVCPWLYSSQPCEKFFRQTRSMTSTYSTVVNFDMLDLLQRRHRIQAIDTVVSESGENFIFPRERNKKLGSKDTTENTHFPSMEELQRILEMAKTDASTAAISLGLTVMNQDDAFSEVSITHIDERNDGNIAHTEEIDYTEETEVHHEDRQDINTERDIFEGLTEVNIKDFTGTKTNDNSTLSIEIDCKKMVVKKSTLCWLFTTRAGRLSSDRLLRFRDSVAQQFTKKPKVSIQIEKYYAVCYSEKWYIGRVIEVIDGESSKIKFLKSELEKYIWPKQEDIQVVRNMFIFYGPISLIGNGPFYVTRFETNEIDIFFRNIRKDLKDYL